MYFKIAKLTLPPRLEEPPAGQPYRTTTEKKSKIYSNEKSFNLLIVLLKTFMFPYNVLVIYLFYYLQDSLA